MDPAVLLGALSLAGVRITRHGDRLRLEPPAAVTPELFQAVVRDKPRLLALVPPAPPTQCPACGGRAFWQRLVAYYDGTVAPGPWTCETCHPRPAQVKEGENLWSVKA